MLRLRLQRRGKRNYATYRVVVADRRAPIKGRFVSDVGSYNPHTDEFKVDNEAVSKWISQGAQPTETVHNLLVTHGVIKADKVTSWRPKVKKEEAAEEGAKEESETPAAAEESAESEASDDKS